MEAEVMVKLEKSDTAAFIAGGVTQGGCNIADAEGIYGSLDTAGHWRVTTDIGVSVCACGIDLTLHCSVFEQG